MKNLLEQTSFTVEQTQDGSPTLRLPNSGESMHHSGGAASETEYIYKSVIRNSLKIVPDAKMAVIGLGLGYIEISWALEVLKDIKRGVSCFVSYETNEDLKTNFLSWLNAESLDSIYDQICLSLMKTESLQQELNPTIVSIKKIILNSLSQFKFRSDLITDYEKNNSYQIVCFDAFSSKTTSQLWSEEFLNHFIQLACHENCVFTTYACTGVLKKVLKANRFKLLPRLGFKGKRDSTLAVRGVFSSSDQIYQTS